MRGHYNRPATEQRLLARSYVDAASPLINGVHCRIYRGVPSTRYGQISHDGQKLNAHQAAFLVWKGWLPPVVMHACDRTRCIEPAHLEAGTQSANRADCVTKERHSRGEMTNTAKLTETQVLAVRLDPRPARTIAAEIGVHFGTVYAIRHRRTWRHI